MASREPFRRVAALDDIRLRVQLVGVAASQDLIDVRANVRVQGHDQLGLGKDMRNVTVAINRRGFREKLLGLFLGQAGSDKRLFDLGIGEVLESPDGFCRRHREQFHQGGRGLEQDWIVFDLSPWSGLAAHDGSFFGVRGQREGEIGLEARDLDGLARRCLGSAGGIMPP